MNNDEELERAKEKVVNNWLEQINELKEDIQRAQSELEKLENDITNFYKLYDKGI